MIQEFERNFPGRNAKKAGFGKDDGFTRFSPRQKKGAGSIFMPQSRYRQAPIHRTQNKSRAQSGASPSASSCGLKIGGFRLGQ
jgi:hypothetical protein